MKHLITAAALALLALPAQAQDKMSVMLDWFVNPDHGPLIIAQELGYFEEAGLEVEMISPADPNDPPKMVAAGRVNLAISYQPQLHLSLHNGLPLTRVGTLVSTPLTCLVTLADGPIQEMTDLKGRKVGFAVAGVQEVMLNAMLAYHDMAPTDVEQINVGWAISPALMSGQVDAVIGAFRNFELNQLEIEGSEGRCFFPEEEGIPAYDELIYVANPETMDRDMLARFLTATERGASFIINNSEKAWEIFSSTSSELQTELNARAWVDTWPRFATRPAAMDAGRYARFEAFLAAGSATEGGIAVDVLTTDVTAP